MLNFRITTLLFPLKKLVLPRKNEKIKKEIKSDQRKIEGVNSANTSGLQDQKMQKKGIVKERYL
jgi:hypothetical protein